MPDDVPSLSDGPVPDRMRVIRLADAYLDAVPRTDADALAVGPFTLFRSHGAWSYYARPALGISRTITGSDLAELDRVRRELSLPLALEWLPDCCPSLETVVREYGLAVHEYVLMALRPNSLDQERPTGAVGPAGYRTGGPVALPHGVTVRLVDPDDPDDPAVPAARAVADVAFGVGGTAPGPVGINERNAMLQGLSPVVVEQMRERIAAGRMVLAIAEREPDGVVGSGAYQPVGEVAEIVGVATLPVVRRQGVATVVSALLASSAFAGGAALVVLSAGSEDIARVYAASGFQRIGRSLAAEPAEPAERAEPDEEA